MKAGEVVRYFVESCYVPVGTVVFVGSSPNKSCVSLLDLASEDWSIGVLPQDGIETDAWWRENSTKDLNKVGEIFSKFYDAGVAEMVIPRNNLLEVINNCNGITHYGSKVVVAKLPELFSFLQCRK